MEFGIVCFDERGIPDYPEKNLGARTRISNKLNPQVTLRPGIEPGPLWWQASALTTVPFLKGVVLYLSSFDYTLSFCAQRNTN